jgi:hypothetical protein
MAEISTRMVEISIFTVILDFSDHGAKKTQLFYVQCVVSVVGVIFKTWHAICKGGFA